MHSTLSKNRLLVRGQTTPRPYVVIAVSQLPEVQKALDEGGVRYVVDETRVSLSGGPPGVVVSLGWDTDGSAVQAILDHQP